MKTLVVQEEVDKVGSKMFTCSCKLSKLTSYRQSLGPKLELPITKNALQGNLTRKKTCIRLALKCKYVENTKMSILCRPSSPSLFYQVSVLYHTYKTCCMSLKIWLGVKNWTTMLALAPQPPSPLSPPAEETPLSASAVSGHSVANETRQTFLQSDHIVFVVIFGLYFFNFPQIC